MTEPKFTPGPAVTSPAVTSSTVTSPAVTSSTVTSSTGTSPAGGERRLASFPAYPDAQRLVDRMSDDGFPVEHVRIIGDGVRTVEQVTGRMTRGKAAAAGASGGAWFGLLFGLLFALFTVSPAWLWVLFGSLLIGTAWGAVFGFVAHWSTRGQRDFASVMTLQAQRYDVYVDASHASEAVRYQQLD